LFKHGNFEKKKQELHARKKNVDQKEISSRGENQIRENVFCDQKCSCIVPGTKTKTKTKTKTQEVLFAKISDFFTKINAF
jgi:hypothetical protein